MAGVQFDIRVETNSGAAAVDAVTGSLGRAATGTVKLNSALAKISTAAFAVNQIKSAVAGVAADFNAAIQPGIEFNSQMKDLQSITGVTDAQLEKIGDSARKTARAFGVDAGAGVESYKLILSQLSPEIGNNAAALDAMGNNAAILSKQLGGDVAGATGILTTAMNQYGVSLDDPMRASKVMGEMMNVMSAAAKEGSAELPQIQSALQQSGLMAKTANVSFMELNGAIQVLDKAGKKGAEGGVAIRNVLAEIGQGARMPKLAADALKLYGVSVDALSDKNKTMSQRLALLKPLMNDTSAMTAIFGKENVAAAVALVQNTDEMDRLTKAVTGTNTATDMANTVMGSFKERMARANAVMKDWGISLFNATEGFIPFIQMGGSGLQMAASLGGAMSTVSVIADTKFGKSIGKSTAAVGGFVKQTALSSVALVKQAAKMGISAALTVGSFVTSLVAATAAQIGLNVAMTANPIGLIVVGVAAAIAAIGALIYWWDEIWGAIKSFTKWMWDHNPFAFLIDVVDNIFPGFKDAMNKLWDWLKKKFTDLIDWFKDTWKSIKGFFGFDDDTVGTKSQAQQMEAAVSDALSGDLKVKAVIDDSKTPTSLSGKKQPGAQSKTSKELSSNISSGGNRPTSISLTIHKIIGVETVHTTNLQTTAKDAGKQIIEEILMALGSINGKISMS